MSVRFSENQTKEANAFWLTHQFDVPVRGKDPEPVVLDTRKVKRLKVKWVH